MTFQMTETPPLNDGANVVTVVTNAPGIAPDWFRFTCARVINDQLILFYSRDNAVTNTRQLRVHLVPSDVDAPVLPPPAIALYVDTVAFPSTPPQARHIYAEG